MLVALARTRMADVAGTLAKRYALEPEDMAWQEADELDRDNNSRFAASQASVAGVEGRRAMWTCL